MNLKIEDIIDKDTSFAQFGLSEELISAVNALGYETPSPIQEKTIPILIEGRDIIGQAQTGTGKTAAFALPMLEKIDPKSKKVQALVLAPTRELAIQVAEAVHSYAKHLGGVRILPVYGGQSISPQIRHLKRGVQIVVGTPGRVMDHIRRETLDIAELKVMVLDEADEMLRMGFIDDVEWILSHTPNTRQTALFSATMPRQIRRIAERYLKNAANIEIKQGTLTVPTIKQYFISLPERQKTEALIKILDVQSTPGEAVLIFHRTKIGTTKLTDKLQARGYAAEAMNGDMNQNQRESVIKRMKKGRIEVVVATDVAARGLDVEHITTVINYDMPSDTESYVHRIGRTGRAGREGKAILFVTHRQRRMMRDIERYTKQKIEPLKLPTEADVAARRAEKLKKKIINTLEKKDLTLYRDLVDSLAEETTVDIAEIAAATAYLAAGDKRIEVNKGSDTKEFSYSEEGMVRMLIGVGRQDRVSPGDIVGAIANEADIPGKVIGAIDVNKNYTLVDIPSQLVDQVLETMRGSSIRGKRMNLRRASAEEMKRLVNSSRGKDSGFSKGKPKRAFKGKGKKAGGLKKKRKPKSTGKPKGKGSFYGNFTKRKKKKKK